MALKMHGAALAAFNSALAITTSDGDAVDTLSQMLTLALEVEGMIQHHTNNKFSNYSQQKWRENHSQKSFLYISKCGVSSSKA